jgi:trk system potassium uptake protein
MKIIVVGCGRMGSSLARTLSVQGHVVVVIDSDPLALERLGTFFKGQTVVGVGFDRDVLIKAGIERSDGLAAVTTSDEANLIAARMASTIFRVPHVVARVYDPEKAEIYRRLGQQTIAPITWGVNRISEMLLNSSLGTTTSLGSGQVNMVEIDVTPLMVGRAVSQCSIPGEVIVVAITRGGKTFIPTSGTEFRDGDICHLAVLASSSERLKSLLGWS